MKQIMLELQTQTRETTSYAKHLQYLCVYCLNIDLKLEAVDHAFRRVSKSNPYNNRYKILDATMCTKQEDDDFHKLACIKGDCLNCPTGLPALRDEVDLASDIQWSYWGKSKDGDSKLAQQEVTTTVDELLTELEKDLQPFKLHLFAAHWQQRQFAKFAEQVTKESSMLVMDFSENFSCIMQRKPQSYHWVNKQITLFPVVCYYMCPQHDDVVREAVIIISDDKCHDAHSVHHYIKQVNKHLCEERRLQMKHQIQFSDGCALNTIQIQNSIRRYILWSCRFWISRTTFFRIMSR